ncbi:carbohydrate kinase [Roseobacter cerasinus]|uniref:Carbohydrate kinase n=1 Tax=Roseobacter cerasinus TaxID=2602289 RepID=A0A640VU82_9RHOB|nr:FGGY family carbohydrate kinase [Roseobacter cerasinus]GFE51212.1 carbohydrate kinase [Roseobacter cerasinus]
MSKLWLGLDVGTTSIKAAAYTPKGGQVAIADAASNVTQRADGGSEQDMEEIAETVRNVLREATKQCAGHEIAALGVAAQGDGIWCVAEDGSPAGPAMLWNDTRTASDLASLDETALTTIDRGCHTALWSGTSGMLWRWIRANRPDMAARTAHAVTCADWIAYQLTGHMATDFSDASIPFLDFATQTYSEAQLAALECSDLASKLQVPRRADTGLGSITAKAGADTGLPVGIPVSVGTLDLGAMIVGMGMDTPGQTMMILGTTAVVNILTDQVTPRDTPLAASVLHPTSDAVIRVLAPTTGAAAFDWFAGLHPQSLGGATAGEVADRLNLLVEKVPPGANGVTFLPYLNGERAPFVAPDIRGAFHGLSATTTTGDMGRAVMEGAVLSLRHCFMAEGGLPRAPVQLTGGGAKNPVWCQIIADVMGQPVLVSAAADHGLWGAAALGAAAAGLGDAVKLAAARADVFDTYTPQNHAAYERVFERYTTISQHQQALQVALSALPKDPS